MSIEATETLGETPDYNFQYNDEVNRCVWNGRIISIGKTSDNDNVSDAILFLLVNHSLQPNPIVVCNAPDTNETEQEKTEDTAQEHFDNALDHLGHFVIDSAAAGFEATHGIFGVGLAIKDISSASEHLVEACKEYNEGKRIEAENNNRGKDDYDRSHDHDSWDREY